MLHAICILTILFCIAGALAGAISCFLRSITATTAQRVLGHFGAGFGCMLVVWLLVGAIH